MTEQWNFYIKLHKIVKSSLTPDFVTHVKNTSKLPEESKCDMEQEITEDELSKVLKTTESNKYPCDDGYPVGFYKKKWPTHEVS